MRHRRIAAVLGLSLATAARAIPAPPDPLHDVTSQGVVYAVPGMDRVEVRRGVSYKTADGASSNPTPTSPTFATPSASARSSRN